MSRRQGPNKRARRLGARLTARARLFAGPTIDVARRLVGAILERKIPPGELGAGAMVSGRIVETEAYLPLVDPACHGYRGPTKRTAVMFGRPGRAYVYFIYGNHFCLNVTTEKPGVGAAVLIRALEPIRGIEVMRARRGDHVADARLASGPGNLCRALAIDLSSNGLDLQKGPLRIRRGSPVRVGAAKRVGLSKAQDLLLRFFDSSSASVSRPPKPAENKRPSSRRH